MSSVPYQVLLDQPTAFRLAERGATLLILGMPERSVLTVDQKRYVVGPRFQGVKMLPPGAHFIGYSAVSTIGEVAPIIWFYLHMKAGQVVVRQWDNSTELLVPLSDTDEADRYSQGVRQLHFDGGLAPYNLQTYQAWKSLSSHITESLVERIAPAGLGQSSITAEADPQGLGPPTAAEERLEEQLQARMSLHSPEGPLVEQAASSTELHTSNLLGRSHYLQVPRLAKVKGTDAAELTRMNLDKSSLLERVLTTCEDPFSLVGELQYAFLAFLMGQSLEAFMQWKALLQLTLACHEAVAAHAQLYQALLQALQSQLAVAFVGEPGQQDATDASAAMGPMLMEGLMHNTFLQRLLTYFREDLPTGLPPGIQDALDGVMHQLTSTFGWHFERQTDSDDEDAPVVVDL